MSLNIYTKKELIPNDMLYISANDPYFNANTPLSDDTLVADIIKNIDGAIRNSEFTFIGREAELGALNKEHLSTGTKTLLNILENPDICFNIEECGVNVLDYIPRIKNGNVFWKHPVHCIDTDGSCDIYLDGKHYVDFYEMVQDVVEGDYE